MGEKVFMVTGATRGLGLGIARALAALPDARVVLAVRDVALGQKVARELGERVEARKLELSSLADVRRFASEWRGPLAGLVNNAGVQPSTTRLTGDGYEETFAVNHLAALLLTVRLLPSLEGGRVLFIGSGTHDPRERGATVFGFRGARYTSIGQLSRGELEPGTSEAQGYKDRYATSKFLNMLTSSELARRFGPDKLQSLVLDPGLMPGTGLARESGAAARAVWSSVMRWAVALIPGASTTERSGAAGAWMLADDALRGRSGEVLGFNRKPAPVWERAKDPALARTAMDESLALLGESLPGG